MRRRRRVALQIGMLFPQVPWTHLASRRAKATQSSKESDPHGVLLQRSSSDVSLCSEHMSSGLKSLTITSLKMLCLHAFTSMRGTANSITLESPSLVCEITDGMWEMYEVINGVYSWSEEDCESCCIVVFLLGHGGTVFLMGLVCLEKNDMFDECIELNQQHFPADRLQDFITLIMKYGNMHREYNLRKEISS